jgi:hypothetical protein
MTDHQPKDPDFKTRVQSSFDRQGLMAIEGREGVRD